MLGGHKISSDIRSVQYRKPIQLLVTSAAGPTQVTSTVGTFFRVARIIAAKTLAGGANTGIVNIGWSSTASQQPIALAVGATIVYEAPVGASHDLSDLYLSVASAGDGIVVVYS